MPILKYSSINDVAEWCHDAASAWDEAASGGWSDGGSITAIEDSRLYLHACTWSLEDAGLDLSAYYQSLEDVATALAAAGYSKEDVRTLLHAAVLDFSDAPISLSAQGESREDLSAALLAAGYSKEDVLLSLSAVSSTVLIDMAMRLEATDGLTLNDISLSLSAIKRAPSFRSVIAQRVTSILQEV